MKLGDKVRDRVSGLEGIATSRTEFLNGCIQYGITPKMKKGATEMSSWNVDHSQLEVIIEKKIKIKRKNTGGPASKIML